MRRALLAGLVAAAACASGASFEDLVEERRYEAAARTFEADSALQASPEALLLAAHFYSDRSLPTHDPERARAALERLTRDFAETMEAEQARPLLFLLTELALVEEELHARAAAVEALVGRVALTDSLGAAHAAAEEELETMRRRVERIEAELEEARRELDRLKAVDLRPRPGAPR